MLTTVTNSQCQWWISGKRQC